MCSVEENVMTFLELNDVFLESNIFVVDLFGKFFGKCNLGIKDRCSRYKKVLQLLNNAIKLIFHVSVCFMCSSTS